MAIVATRGSQARFRTTSRAIAICIDWPLSEPLVVVKYLSYFHFTLDVTIFIAAIQGKRRKRNSLDKKKLSI